jgi:hypothetical protein
MLCTRIKKDEIILLLTKKTGTGCQVNGTHRSDIIYLTFAKLQQNCMAIELY